MTLALTRPRMVTPQAHYAPRPVDGILVLQRGENASTDYYLRPRLARSGLPAEVLDIEDDPAASALLAPGGARALMVVVCRYASPAWLGVLEAAGDRLARVAFFADDDLVEMMRARDVPVGGRGKVALHFGTYAGRLSALSSELWVSTPVLAERYGPATILPPLPEAPPPDPSPDAPPLVVYHGTDVHERERRFVLEVARIAAAAAPGMAFEIAGDEALARAAADLANVRVVPQLPWPAYLQALAGRRAAISLAPLYPSALNDARAPVKAFDAARLGAAGLYADAPAYRGFVRHGEDGLVLPMQARLWASAIAALAEAPTERLRLAGSARARLAAMLAADPGFPAQPAA